MYDLHEKTILRYTRAVDFDDRRMIDASHDFDFALQRRAIFEVVHDLRRHVSIPPLGRVHR